MSGVVRLDLLGPGLGLRRAGPGGRLCTGRLPQSCKRAPASRRNAVLDIFCVRMLVASFSRLGPYLVGGFGWHESDDGELRLPDQRAVQPIMVRCLSRSEAPVPGSLEKGVLS